MALTLVGLVIGLLGSFALTRFLSSLLFNISPTDPVTFALIDPADRICTAGLLLSGSTRDEGRSNGGAAVRVRGFAEGGFPITERTFVVLIREGRHDE
jgi:hypothetical protein